MNIKYNLSLCVLALSMSGCATSPSAGASTIQFTDLNHVASCVYLGPINGTSGWGGLANSVGVNNAKNEVLDTAYQIGATHIVNKSASGGWGSTFMADAYKCD